MKGVLYRNPQPSSGAGGEDGERCYLSELVPLYGALNRKAVNGFMWYSHHLESNLVAAS